MTRVTHPQYHLSRLRSQPHVRVGPCTERGKPLRPLGRQVYERMGDRMGVETVYIEVTPEEPST